MRQYGKYALNAEYARGSHDETFIFVSGVRGFRNSLIHATILCNLKGGWGLINIYYKSIVMLIRFINNFIIGKKSSTIANFTYLASFRGFPYI